MTACSPTEGPERATNGSWTLGNADKWCSTTAGTKTLQVDLGASATITGFTIKHAGAGGETADFNTRAYTIQVSADGSSWSTPVTISANTANETSHTVTTSGRYARLNVTTPTQNADPAARIYEFQVLGTIGSPASPGRTERIDHIYDLAGQELTTTVDTGGLNLLTTLVRDPRRLVTRETSPSGVVTDHTYDVTGALLTTTGAARDIWVNGTVTAAVQPVTTVGRNTFGDVTQQRDPNSQTTTMAYDAMGRTTSTTQPGYTPPGGSLITATSSTGYNLQGLSTTQTDALGNVTMNTYDKYGRLLTVTEPDPDAGGPKPSPVTTMEYSRNGELLKTIDPAGGQTLATYDELGRAITDTRTERPGGMLTYYITTLAYNDAGDLTSATTPLGHTTTSTYNNAGEALRTTDATGRFTQSTYDLAGRVMSTAAGQNTTYANPVTTSTYDLAGRRTSTSDCTATGTGTCNSVLRTSTTAYNGANQVTQQTSAEGRPTFHGYNAAGQLTSVTQRVNPASGATAITVNLGYDRNGNQTRRLDGNTNATTYTYTPWNLTESVIEPSTTAHPNASDRTWTNVYNAAGWLTEQRLPGGVTRTSTYDKMGRQTAETATGATTTARSLDYDTAGRTTSASSPAGNHTYTWTDRGELASATGYGGTATYTYDSDNRPTGRTDAAGAATFGYDDADRITSIVDPLTATTATNSYDAAGRLSTVTHGAAKSTRAYTYDTLGRVSTDTTKKPDTTTAASITYGYDTDGLLTSKTTVGLTGAGANTYGYDGLGRVISWLNPNGTTTTYGYDAASNRTTVTTPAGTRTSAFDQRNRLTGTTGAPLPADSYTWSPRGTLATATKAGVTTTYTFDGFERLTQAQKSPGYTVTFTYDSLDRPAQRGAADFGYNNLSNNPILSPTAAGEAKLLRQPDGDPLATKTGAGTGTLLVQDQVHGDLAATADVTTGLPSASADYDPWGTTTSTSGTLPLGYQGGWTDYEAALVNAHARWYDPASAGFTSRDTVTLQVPPLAQANRYLYSNGSSLVLTDTNGHEPGSWCPNTSCAIVNAQRQTSHPMEVGFDAQGRARTKAAPQIDPSVYATAIVMEADLCRPSYFAPGTCDLDKEKGATELYKEAYQAYVTFRVHNGFTYMPDTTCLECTWSAPPRECTDRTPEYCHDPGSNNNDPLTLFAQWAWVEGQGACFERKCEHNMNFRDGDLFTEQIKKMDTMEATRADIRSQIQHGADHNTAHFHISDLSDRQKAAYAYLNLVGIATLGTVGMDLGLAFVGSYDLDWRIVGEDVRGNPVVEFHVSNASTMASAALNPNKVFHYAGEEPGANSSAGDGHDAKLFESYTHQSVRWREVIVL